MNAQHIPKILIVDDKPENLFTLQKLLQQLAVEIIQTTSPIEALELALGADFCLAIVDVQMPEMDGYELVELLRSNEGTATLPVIFVSAIYSDEYHHRKGYDAGAVDFMSKPFIPEILLSKVKVFLELYAQRHKLQELVHHLEDEIKQREQAEYALYEANQTLAKWALQLEISSQVGRRTTAILELKELLDTVVDLIEAQFGYYFTGVWLLDEEQGGMVLEASSGCEGCQPLEPGSLIPLDTPNSVIVSVCQSGRPYRTYNIQDECDRLTLTGLPNTCSELVLPLRFGEWQIGVLDIHSERMAAFDPEDQTVLQMLADQIAIAIHNAWLYSREKNLRELEAQKTQALTELNASKDKFFSIVAHDLRGPFNPLLGMAKLLSMQAATASPAELEEMADGIYQSAYAVYNLLENLLEWSRIQRGRLEYEPDRLELQKVVEQNIKLLAGNAASKEISLDNNVPQGLVLYADENMLHTVLRNLVSNAVKFTPIGGQVTVSAGQSATSLNLAEIAITDTGHGISPEDQAKLFNLKTTHTTRGTAQEKGSGLGLIICQEMVEKNGGQIWIESSVGQGTTVKFTVPLVEMTPATTTLPPAPAEAKPGSSQLLPAPPPEKIALLHELALVGNMLGLEQEVGRLAEENPRLIPFADKLRRMARGFEEEQILAFIEQYMGAEK